MNVHHPISLSDAPTQNSGMVASQPGLPKGLQGRHCHSTQHRCVERPELSTGLLHVAPWGGQALLALGSLLGKWQEGVSHLVCRPHRSSLSRLISSRERAALSVPSLRTGSDVDQTEYGGPPSSERVQEHPPRGGAFSQLCCGSPPLSFSSFYDSSPSYSSYFCASFSPDFPSLLRTDDMLLCSLGGICGGSESPRQSV